jgi:hypothetical protein
MAAHAGQWHGHLDQWRHRAWVCSRNASVPARPRRHDPTHRCGELRLQNCRRLHKPMTSFRQIEVNRNALRSTGPKTEAGKRRSRRSSTPSDCRNRSCRSGRHRRLSSIRSGYHRAEATWSASWCSGLHRCCGACVVPAPLRPISFRSRPRMNTRLGIGPRITERVIKRFDQQRLGDR